MRLVTVGLSAALAALWVSSASAAMVITSDSGGQIGAYVSRFQQVRQSGEQVVIDGQCLSACTMVLGLVPRNRVCATPRAVLGFHAAWRPDGNGGRVTSGEATRALMSVYPSHVRSWIARRGGLSPQMKYLQGRELAAMVPTCGSTQSAAAPRPRARTVSRQVLRSALGRGNNAAPSGR
jgi:hypothetical protein